MFIVFKLHYLLGTMSQILVKLGQTRMSLMALENLLGQVFLNVSTQGDA